MVGKIAIASSGLGHVARGIEAWANDLGAALMERGVGAILCKGAGVAEQGYERVVPCWTRESKQAVRVVRRMPSFLGWRVGLGSGYSVEQTTFTWNLLKVLRKDRIDILHVQDPQVAMLVQRARKIGIVRSKVILAHGTEEPLEFQRRITYLQHLAPWHLDETREAGIWKPSWTAIPNFIDTELFSTGESPELRAELGIPQEAIVLLSAAAIKRGHKRVDHLINEFEIARRQAPDLPLWLIVAGGWEKETDEVVAEGRQRLGERVKFLVRFPRKRMPDLYRAADAFTLCSLKEMMPIALLEAAASGLPCLVNRHPVMEWMIGPGGEAIDMAGEGHLASWIVKLAQDNGLRAVLGEEARRHCLNNFSKQRVVDQILDYYEAVHCDRFQQPTLAGGPLGAG